MIGQGTYNSVFRAGEVDTGIIVALKEDEQLHKIFKLCGSPPDEFWRNSDLPHATVFKPQRLYVNCIKETFECLPDGALRLLETFLSIVLNNRGSASSALSSEANCFLKLVRYFRTRSYACEPSSLPKYQPNKEIDLKDDAVVGEEMSISPFHFNDEGY
ncbi:hypothetical protein ZIOFF_011743 [Zingiber officinale]|uniref:Uncharacterized protein n=1 Tax=Zingiber officinale TaxID=94328 RepID=A0A8J5LQA2_ZINOF|nr:hypothetical protein ZIOFF_011743 [Zingiber officinale]